VAQTQKQAKENQSMHKYMCSNRYHYFLTRSVRQALTVSLILGLCSTSFTKSVVPRKQERESANEIDDRPARSRDSAISPVKVASNSRVTVTDIGPELGISYAIEGFVINPLNRQQMLLPSQNGLFKSTDGGSSWRRLTLDPGFSMLENVVSVRRDPRAPLTVYAITRNPFVFGWGLFKSLDFGETWHILLGLPNDLADCAPHQTSPNIIFALQSTAHNAIETDQPGSALLKSTDGVFFDYLLGTGLPEIVYDEESGDRLSNPIFTSMATSPTDPNVLYVVNVFDRLQGSTGGVYRSTDGGATFTRLANSPPEPLQVFPHPTQPNILFVQAQGEGFLTGIFRSTDNGVTFEELTNGLPEGEFNFFVAFDPQDPSLVYIAGEAGLFRSTDGGSNFSPTGLRDSQIGVGASTLSVDPANSNIVYVNTSQGNFKSVNGGNSFQPINRGWRAASVNHIIFDNGAQPNLYLTTGFGNGLFRTASRGKFYEALSPPVEQTATPTSRVSSLAVAPTDSNFMVALTPADGIFRSLDGGKSWNVSQTDTGQQIFTSFRSRAAIDPLNSSNVYIACGNAGSPGFYRSVDHAETFERSFFLPSSQTLLSNLAIDPLHPNVIYTGSKMTLLGGALLKSIDSGLSFGSIALGDFVSIEDIVVDPKNPNNVYVGGVFADDFGDHKVLYSDDGGVTFVPADNGLEGNYLALAIDPLNPARLFAWTEDGLFMTVNRGVEWTLLDNIETMRRAKDFGRSMAVNPKNPNLIYLAGASVLEVEIK
jgi:photosystem II stability/assembly factor-like uncharacterized protein